VTDRKETRAGTTPSRKSIVAHYHASQLRNDTWKSLEHRLRRLVEDGPGSGGEDLRPGIAADMEALGFIESYWAFPGRRTFRDLVRLHEVEDFPSLSRRVTRIERLLVSDAYRRRTVTLQEPEPGLAAPRAGLEDEEPSSRAESRPYFEILFVGNLSRDEETEIRSRLLEMRREGDAFIYDAVFVPSYEDALIATLFNYNIQSCVLRYAFPVKSANQVEVLREYLGTIDPAQPGAGAGGGIAIRLAEHIKSLRPELDLFLVTDAPVEDVASHIGRSFRRIFYRSEDYLELHLSILKGIQERYETPFFDALRAYSQKPTGVFHALPISRGKSISKSHWIGDMGKFYGENVFLAETSATGGGLDSLLQPHGPLKQAQVQAARAFGARQTFFVTNGTSTANKIVVQALVKPGDIVLASRDCHKSHHYAILLAGGHPVYLDAYPLHEYSMYGAIPLSSMKRALLDLRREGKLDRVKLVLLTNCTFDGVVYDPQRVMHELLAIKPDLVFLWDEAWFAYARFLPAYRQRSAMHAAERLRALYRSPEYAERHLRWKEAFAKRAGEGDGAWIEGPLMPDPEAVRVRAYSTQSTHKTLTSLRQGSMIHVHDQDFGARASDAFHESYMTHTSTSPNYQILASLDVGRRQVELEGYELVRQSLELAMILRSRISSHSLLSRYFRVLGAKDMVPEEFRPSGFEYYFTTGHGWTSMEEAWHSDEFTLDPTRITLHVGNTGMDGDTFKRKLIEEYDIQINKTSRNSVLFMVHIGVTRGPVAYLISVLTRIAEELDARIDQFSAVERERHDERVRSLTENLPPLPDFSRFHPAFRPSPAGKTPEGDMRGAFFAAYDEADCRYEKLDGGLQQALEAGKAVVSAAFVTPYPPGFPVLVPGQEISCEILSYLRALDVKEIHGYNPDHGLKVFSDEALARRLGKGKAR